MKTAEENLRKYLAAQFPATVGNIQLSNLIDALDKESKHTGWVEGMREAAEITGKENWKPGVPDKLHGQVWFIAKLDNGDRVVLRSLPEGFSYDYTTADETYYKANRISKWMPFWDGEFRNPLEEAILTAIEKGGA